MRMHMTRRSIVIAACLSLGATSAFAAEGPAAPAAPPAPAPPTDYAVTAAVPNPQDDAARQARDAAQQAALQARLDAARQRLEVAAQQLAALSAQMYGPMAQHFEALGGPPRALIGVQLAPEGGAGGARVREVSPGGPAEQAGVRAGDTILAVNGTDVRGKASARRVVELLHDLKPGDKVSLRISRDGKVRDLTVTARPGMDDLFLAMPRALGLQLPDLPDFKGLSAWGGPVIIAGPVADMELAKLTPALGRYFGKNSGVLVVRAPPDGALGLQDGDVILSIDGRKPIDSSHVIRILGSYDPGEKMTIEVLRLHRKVSVATTIPARSGAPRRVFIRNGALVGPGPTTEPGPMMGPGPDGPGPVITLRHDDRTI
jgi:membrane-associated protease RseP (regulator of RpoE activity)